MEDMMKAIAKALLTYISDDLEEIVGEMVERKLLEEFEREGAIERAVEDILDNMEFTVQVRR
jgi:Asp-tRNA(Asn)/Glu-tRNA(Gln) amidotransferase B subunit